MSDDEIQRAMAIGRENEKLISLGRAWCTHIRTDRTGLGVGMVEEMTGLPITGGRFTCDFARNPSGMSGMQLGASAVGFYEDNCRGCEYRNPGGRIPNLGTWAEPLIEARNQRDEEARRAAEVADTERQLRARHRTLIAAGLDAFAQEIVALINRLDTDPSGSEAGELLRTASRLTPEAFPPELIEILTTDAAALRSGVLLDALIAVQGMSDPTPLHELCVRAVRDGWGRTEGCRHLADHGRSDDVSDDFLQSVIFHAAPSGWSLSERPGQPAALRRYHSIAPEMVEEGIRGLLRHGDSWRRAAGAAAADAIGAEDPDAVTRLLPALLDGLRYQEDQFDHERPSDHIAGAVARLVAISPEVVEAAIDARWNNATSAYRKRIISCLNYLIRHARSELPPGVAALVINRAVAALFEPYDRERHNLDEDYQRRASHLLKYVVAHAPPGVLSLDVLLGLLLVWIDRKREVAEWVPDGPLAGLQKLGTEAHIGGLLREIAGAVTSAGHRDRESFIAACRDSLAGAASSTVHAEVVRMLGDVASASVEQLGDALPMIYTAMLGEDQGVRAAGLQAATAVMRHLPEVSIPPTLCEAVVAGLTDQYLIVVVRATEAVRFIPVDAVDAASIAMRLLTIAQAYAHDRLRESMVSDALSGAIRFGRGDQAVYAMVRAAVVRIIGQMPAYHARETLCSIRSLRDDPGWTDTAIAALRPDEDPQYEDLGEDDKEALLAELGRRSLTAGQIERLAANEMDAGRHDRGRALLGADTLAELRRPDLAVDILREHLDYIPDTIERRATRRGVRLLLLQHELEAAVARDDLDRLREIKEEVASASPDEDD